MNTAYEKLMERVRESHVLSSIQELLDWDQDVCMPDKGVTARAEQTALMAALAHERKTAPELGELLGQLDSRVDDPVMTTNIRETRRTYERAVKVPVALVREIAQVSTLAKDTWAKARKASDFAAFAPHLARLVDLRRQTAECIGYDDEPYDALLDEFEPGTKASDVAAVFGQLREALVPVVRTMAESGRGPDDGVLRRHYPPDAQRVLVQKLCGAVGFDFQAGRMDVSTHPFTSGATPCDVRLTTRYDESFLPTSIFGAIHEAGHGLYQQGLPEEHRFTPRGSYVSLGIHESQSRLWENFVGRSRAFWTRFYSDVQRLFPDALGDVPLDAFVAAINVVSPSLIRVEADEVTYALHIILRFELERDLVSGRLAIDDVPDAWNAKMTELLGITPSNDREGCLQDIHWSLGVFGYFPTYALGNLYAAQFFEAARRDVPDLMERIGRGDLATLLEWLREKIHGQGMRYRAAELVERVTGRPLSIEPFMRYVRDKFGPMYEV